VQKKLTKSEIVLIISASIIPWLPILFTSFLNDDYQIIGFHQNINFYQLLKPFYTPDISGYYWRPLGNFLHVLTLLITGFNAFAFRFGNLALYSLCCLQLASTSVKIGLDKKTALFSALLFALLPSHSFMIGWIASKGEFLLAILILLAYQNYIAGVSNNAKEGKPLLKALFFFVAALLVKELSFAMLFLPAAVFILRGSYVKKEFMKAVNHTVVILLLIVTYLVIRFFIVGGTPFSSPHFQDKNVFSYVKNYFIYIVISFVTPEQIEAFLNSGLRLAIAAGLLLVFAASLFFIYKQRKSVVAEKKNILWGVLWFSIFILPVLPILMRWYPFTASIGLVWIISILVIKTTDNKKVYYIFPLLLTVLAGYNFYSSLNWYCAGKKMDSIVASLAENKNIAACDSVLVLGSPDKLNSIPLMKLGVQQTFEYALKKKIEVFAPLRCELLNNKAKIEVVKEGRGDMTLKITNGLFLAEGSRTALTKKAAELFDEVDKVKIKVINSGGNGTAQSTAEIAIDEKYRNYKIIYFDGKKFELVTRN